MDAENKQERFLASLGMTPGKPIKLSSALFLFGQQEMKTPHGGAVPSGAAFFYFL